MNALLINFSDIHIKDNSDNYILEKKEALIRAIKPRIRDKDKIYIIISGDTAFSGSSEEYEIAFDFLTEIVSGITSTKKVDIILIAGNHDCEFRTMDTEIREIVINSIKNDSDVTSEKLSKVVVQKNYSNFSEVFQSDWENTVLVEEDILSKIIKIKIGFNEFIKINLFNTSWCSSLNEKPGEMFMPINMLSHVIYDKEAILNLSLIHHPTHWLEPNNKREFDKILTDNSDMIISGHEHNNSIKTSVDSFGHTFYVEGSVLQENSDEKISGFNLINICRSKQKLEIELTQLNWDNQSKMYNVSEDYTTELETKVKRVNNINVGESSLFVNTEKFSEFLKDVGAPIKHPRISNLTFEDLYAYPSFRKHVLEKKKYEKIESENLLNEISKKSGVWFIEGENESGKTSFLKAMNNYMLSNEIVPLYLEGELIKNKASLDKIDKILESVYCSQFVGNNFERFTQLEKQKKILLIDNWEKVYLNKIGKKEFLSILSQRFDKIVIMAESTPSNMSDIIGIGEETKLLIRFCEIEKFGYQKREELIERWIRIGNEYKLEEHEVSVEVDKYTKQITEVIGKSFVPQMPIYILIILQSMAFDRDLTEFNNQSNGYYYELLLKQMLVDIGISNNEIATIHNYLSHLAYKIFVHPKKSLNISEWSEFHSKYVTLYDLDPMYTEFSVYKEKLYKSRMLRMFFNDRISFNYNYGLYFFTAQYLSDNIAEEAIKKIILDLIDDINIELNSNVLIFLSHISKDDFILNSLMDVANKTLNEIPELRLEEDIASLNSLMKDELPELIFVETNTKETRKQLNELRDEVGVESKHYLEDVQENNTQDLGLIEDEKNQDLIDTQENVNTAKDTLEKSGMLIEMDKAQRISEVIGQILKNYSGSILGERKQMLLDSAYAVSLRAGNNLVNIIKDEKEDLVSFISDMLMEQDSLKTDNKLKVEEEARKFLFQFVEMICISIIGKSVKDTGSRALKMTYEKIENTDVSTMRKLIISTSYLEAMYVNPTTGYIQETYKELRNNPIAKSILARTVRKSLYLIDRPLSERQQIASTYGIKYDSKKQARINSEK